MNSTTNTQATEDLESDIQAHFFDTLTNGFRDDLNANPERLGFILGAIDSGWSVSKVGVVRAKRGKAEIFLQADREDDKKLHVTIFKGKERVKQLEYSREGFQWVKVHTLKGR